MSSDLEIAIERTRAAILARDDAALKRIAAIYRPVRDRLIERIEALVAEIAETGVTDGTAALKLDRATALLAQVEDELDALSGPLDALTRTLQRQAIQLSLDVTTALVEAQSVTLAASWNKLNTGAINDLVGRLSDGSPLRSWLDQLGPQTSAAIQEAIASAVGLGTHPRGLADELGKLVNWPGYRVQAFSRSVVLDTYRSAALERYRQNSDIVDEWEWLSALQDRTCRACLALDGQRFPLTEVFQKAHRQCRCTSIPVLKGVRIKRETGAEWFAKQPTSVQDTVLGKEGGLLYRDGSVTLDDFVVLHNDARWGDSYQAGSVATAQQRASMRARRAA